MELNSNQMYNLIGKFPKFDHSYETVSQTGFSPDYNSALAIPLGKKNFAWFTFLREFDVCYLLDLNKEKKIVKASRIMKEPNNPLGKGTIVYGTTVLDEITAQTYFVIEDIYFYKGIPLKNITFGDKLPYIKEFLDSIQKCELNIIFTLPVMWACLATDGLSSVIPPTIIHTIGYQTHHIQYRTMNIIKPHLNIILNKQLNATTITDESILRIPRKIYSQEHVIDTFKPQYRQNTVFQVSADIQFDIYHLHAFGKNNTRVYYDVAYIPNYESSVFMNGLFRNIRENKNLDYIEESDDDDDFQNVDEDKYVDTNKTIKMECTYHMKFKRWVPVRYSDKYSKVIHISRLVKDYY
jgi:hypothetical protein